MKYLLEIGFSLSWPEWGENVSRMFRAYVPTVAAEDTQSWKEIHSFEFMRSCDTLIDMTNERWIKNRNAVSSGAIDKNTYYAYCSVPPCNVDEVYNQWKKMVAYE